MNEFLPLGRAIAALGPALPEAVIIGGWAHRLFGLHPLAIPLEFEPLRTFDADVALPLGAKVTGSLDERLQEAGFKLEFKGDAHPPVSRYHLEGFEGFYLEFLANLEGSATDRQGRAKATVTIGGVTAQRLRHLGLLLVAPWEVHLEPSAVPVEKLVTVRIPNPVSYMVQKLLILDDRVQADRAKDILYIHDTLLMFGDARNEMARLWVESVGPSLHATTRAGLKKLAGKHLAPDGALAAEAAHLVKATKRAAAPSPGTLVGICREGLRFAFDDPND
jgi:hypothetical protein